MAKFLWGRSLVILVAIAGLLGFSLVGCLPSQPPPPTTAAPIRAAFYYGWLGGPGGMGWNQQGLDPFTRYHPTAGYYSSNDLPTVQRHVQEMQYAGLQVGISSWWGQGSFTDKSFPVQLQAAQGTSFRWALYYEPEGIGNPTVNTVEGDLAYIKAHYTDNPAYLKLNGKPVIFVFNADDTSCSVADKWHQAAQDVGFYVSLKVFSGYANCANQPDDWHQYAGAAAEDKQGVHSIAISPGFWKANESTPRLARDLTRWKQNVADLAASKAHWALITTFNEWGEGTAIEPATEWSSASGYGSYIDVLHDALGTSTQPPPTTTTTLPTTTTSAPSTTTSQPPSTTTSTLPPTTTTTQAPPPPAGVCNNGAARPAKYDSVVVFSFENRTWSDVGGTNFSGVPYFNSLFKQGCTTFSNYTEPDTSQNSATQYVGTAAGSTANTVRNDCSPSASCQSTQDNIFRQVRETGATVRNYVEGATTGCSASGNAVKHIPDMYFFGGNDHSFCSTEVRPFTEFNPASPPAGFSFITPTLCNDGHDCSNSTVSSWASSHVAAVLNSAAYKAGKVLVIIWYDEDHPVPNMFIAPTAKPGALSTAVNYASQVRLWEEALGLTVRIGNAPGAVDIRPLANI